ncbi:hypothetical protein MGG_17727 [Pyricularia oryzae 70-15]|uniref:Uncharacterized protein n=1 Tax=Pyricularia oryzae (strain 70-15 / ATCC MYA-4617 / FGSC 8958) TaxID=242507 RepID=G4NH65_PYRO7|nr:uncharacterized protein MGG_17727 [Pyricularia oryzae 70-15]EHA47575.1 hypothetical protein MGG_17727 [Pyricularia oryzae 70-15]
MQERSVPIFFTPRIHDLCCTPQTDLGFKVHPYSLAIVEFATTSQAEDKPQRFCKRCAPSSRDWRAAQLHCPIETDVGNYLGKPSENL